MPSEQRRGLNIGVDRDQTKVVTKAAWIKFYHQWTESGMGIEEYLNKIAEDNPTLLQATAGKVKALADMSVETAKNQLASVGIESTDDAKKKLVEGMGQLGGKFGFGKKEEKEEKEVAQ